MNKLPVIVNKKWFPVLFFLIMVSIGIIQHYRVFSLDIIGYHAWRQTQTQTVIENFANEDFNIFHPRVNDLVYYDRIYRMEFPLMQWLIAGLYKLFGQHLIITRLFSFALTLISVFGIYKTTYLLHQKKDVALITSWLFFFSPIMYYYSMNPMPDNMALSCVIWALFFWIKYLKQNQIQTLIWSALFLSVSVAVKLPFIVFTVMYVSLLFKPSVHPATKIKSLLIPMFFLLPSLLWYIWVIQSWRGNGVVGGILDNHESLLKLLDIFQFNLISTLPELLINYATVPLFLAGLYFAYKQFNKQNAIHLSLLFILTGCILYFLFEMNMINKVHDYYLFPFMPIIFIIISLGISSLLKISSPLKWLIVLAFAISPLTAYLRSHTRWNLYTPGFSHEYLFYKKQLQQLIPAKEPVIVTGDDSRSIILYHLNRKGWCYDKNHISKPELYQRIYVDHAKYLIFDCQTDTVSYIIPHLDSLLFHQGEIKLYKLK